MKKIILAILIIILIFPVNVLATAIDIGNPAINRDDYSGPYTFIDANNPANATGKITTVEIYAYAPMSGVEVAMFYSPNPQHSESYFSTRSHVTLGSIPSGYSSHEVNLDVVVGDYIGIYSTGSGYIECSWISGVGYWVSGRLNDRIPCTNLPFGWVANRKLSLYGTGVTVPDQVTGVSATDGTYTDKVRVTWNAASGADKYYVWQGSSWVDVGNVTTWDHTGAPAPTITHGSITASDGTYTDKVALSNTGASANNGSSISYKVKAWNTVGYGAESASNSGYRGVGTLTYQWYRSAGDSDASYSVVSGATASTYDDTGAPAPTITPGSASASDGTSELHVALSLSGQSANNGAGRYYKCYHTATGATSDYTGVDRGYRGVGALTYQWQRSAGDSDADYLNIDGATTDPYNDIGAPADGSGRHYRCYLTATGADPQISTSDRGYRLVPYWTGPWNNTTISKWNTKEIMKWNGID